MLACAGEWLNVFWERRMAVNPAASDPYAVLQVVHSAEPEVIRAAYRALATKWHPDRGASAERMVAINAAWRVLGDAGRRAAYDRSNLGDSAPIHQEAPEHAPESGLPPRRPREVERAETVIDFGRYAGWTVAALVDHDPDYLVWLARTPIGRRLAPEIDAALVHREADAATLAPTPVRRSMSFIRRRVVEAR
jgi:hypothetical protein